MTDILIVIVISQVISTALFWITFYQLEAIQKNICQNDNIIAHITKQQSEMINVFLDIDSRVTKLVKTCKDMALYHEEQNQFRIKDIQRLYKRSKHEYRSSNIKTRKSK